MQRPLVKNQIEQQLKEKMEIFIDGLYANNESYKKVAGRALRKSNNGEVMAIYRTNKRAINDLKSKYDI